MNLAPVIDALLADARRDRDETLAAAERDADEVLAAARREAAALREDARAAGEAQARAAAARAVAQERRAARGVVLAARREAVDRARAAAHRAVAAGRDDPGYDRLLAGLAARARRQLGQDAVVEVDDEVGGLVARAGTRSVDYRLPAVTDRCFDALGPEVASLWR